MKHVFIVNPYAGKKDSESLIPTIEEYFKSRNLDNYEIVLTEKAGHATDIAHRYIKEDDVTLYGVGGDGTIFEILNGLNEGVKMAIVPNGTGNDYFKMLEVEKTDIKDLLIKTIEGKEVKVEYGVANNRRYLNASSMGLDADINEEANRIGKKYPIPKSLVYIVAALKLIGNPKTLNFTVKIDNEEPFKAQGFMAGCMAGRYYGGGFLPTPMASLQDGKLDFFLVKPVHKMTRLLPLMVKYIKGTHVNEPEVEFRKCERVVLDSDTEVLFGCDGEPIKAKHIEYFIVKEGLTLRVPQESKLQ